MTLSTQPGSQSSQIVGILPIAKSITSKFSLPGHGDPYHDCGEFFTKGCLNVEGHKQQKLDLNVAGLVLIRRIMRTCLRSECPTCYQKWAGKEANKIEHRLLGAKQGRLHWGRVIHVTVSLPESDYGLEMENYPKLRVKIYKILKKVGLFGGSMLYHPWRQRPNRSWYYSPHFHILGYGWIRGKKVASLSKRTGYVVKNLGVRKSIVATAQYQLSHCGIKKGTHSVTWFGELAYNKVKVKPKKAQPEVCPVCGEPLSYVFWKLDGPDPLEGEEEGDYWIDPGGWS